MFIPRVSLMRSFFIVVSLAALIISPIACGGGGGGGDSDDPPPVTVPSVVSTTPSDGASQVSSDTDVILNFSEEMNPTSVVTGFGIATYSGITTAVWQVGSTRVDFSFDPLLSEDTHYIVTLAAAVLDAEGTSLGSAYSFSFDTGSIPIATINSPADGATNVSTSPTINITFTEDMDATSVEDEFGVIGYSGTLTFTWNTLADLDITFDTALDPNLTYIISLLPFAKDAQGTPLGVSHQVTFSTGSTIATGAISGVIDDDPDSNYDNNLENTTVILFDHDFTSTDGPAPILASADASGAYHFSFLEDGDYWVMALQDTNGDGEIGGDKFVESGDSAGIWSDLASFSIDMITVSGGGEESGISFTLLDTEAISGEVTYAGSNTTEAYSASSTVFVGAFTSSELSGVAPDYGAESSTADEEDFDSGTNIWNYAINSFFQSPSARMMTGSYFVGAYIDLDNDSSFDADMDGDGDFDDGEPAGVFASAVPILATGQDASGVDIIAYDTITIFGSMDAMTVMDVEVPYEGATVSLLDYPVTASTDASGDYFMSFVPIGMELAVHAEPQSGSSLMPYNTQYFTMGSRQAYMGNSDPNADGVRGFFLGSSVLDDVGALCNVTVNPSRAQIGGSSNVVGAEILFASSTVYYMDSEMNCGYSSIQADGDPAFFIFNVDADDFIASGNKASISTSGGVTVTADIPVRQGEFTWVELID